MIRLHAYIHHIIAYPSSWYNFTAQKQVFSLLLTFFFLPTSAGMLHDIAADQTLFPATIPQFVTCLRHSHELFALLAQINASTTNRSSKSIKYRLQIHKQTKKRTFFFQLVLYEFHHSPPHPRHTPRPPPPHPTRPELIFFNNSV